VTAVGGTELSERITASLRERPSNRLLRQLARCAKEYRCRAATNAFARVDDCALPVGAPPSEQPVAGISLRDSADASPGDVAAFKPSSDEIADVAASHFESGGAVAAFGRACEGEPLRALRPIEAAIAAVRGRTSRGTLHLETGGFDQSGVRRIVEAGIDSISVRLASARAETYEAIHRPSGYRFADVRATVAATAASGVALSLRALVLPGLFDREDEIDAIASLAGGLARGSSLLFADLAVDPAIVPRVVPRGPAPMGVAMAVAALRERLPDLRFASQPRPLARL
jgi:hypothetical protein